MAGLNTEGFNELYTRLESMSTNAQKVVDKALKKAAEPILQDMKSNAPVRTGLGRELLSTSKPETKNGKRFVTIGINKGDNSKIFYLKFYEWGTTKQVARPFVTPSFYRNRDQASEIIKQEIREALDL
jgi:HK97 gp10 family phage protein